MRSVNSTPRCTLALAACALALSAAAPAAALEPRREHAQDAMDMGRAKSDIRGFQDAVLGARAESLTGLKEVKRDGDDTWYVRPADKLAWEDIPLTSITYVTHKGTIVEIEVATAMDRMPRVLEALTAAYGMPFTGRSGKSWERAGNRVVMSAEGGKGTVRFIEGRLRDEMHRDREARAKPK